MQALLHRLSRRLLRQGIRRGLFEGSELWIAIGAVALLVRVLTKPWQPPVAGERLRVGESIVVTHLPPPPGRRAARRAARGAA